jgi:hypothetical protein
MRERATSTTKVLGLVVEGVWNFFAVQKGNKIHFGEKKFAAEMTRTRHEYA